MFVDYVYGLTLLLNENNLQSDQLVTKRIVNWGLRDIANEFDWPFLRGSKDITVSANGTYNLDPITQPDGNGVLYFSCSANATATIAGRYLAASSVFASAEAVVIASGTTASATQQYSHIEWITKAASTANVYVTCNGTVIATLNAADTLISNDVRKINKIVDPTNNKVIVPLDWNTQLEGNPNSTQYGTISGYDRDYNNTLRFFNIDQSKSLTVYYQRLNKYLVRGQDRSEFPEQFTSDIIDYCFRAYGKRFEDEADVTPDTVMKDLKQELIGEMVRKYTMGGDSKRAVLRPAWLIRRT